MSELRRRRDNHSKVCRSNMGGISYSTKQQSMRAFGEGGPKRMGVL